ncbi:MAG: LEA type 2 family protein [Gemmatimonadota bacterium]|jgi:hypothetical protein|nr:LEA type 2 family protein [Gemmatimonadota bacterium]
MIKFLIRRSALPLFLVLLLAGGCASLGLGVLAPRFSMAGDQPSQLRLLGPSLDRPLGGASVRIYARIENPNPMGITLSALTGRLSLEGVEAADANFPLGMPLAANGSAVVPLDISVSFSSLPRVAELVGQAVLRGSVSYSLDGVATVDAGLLGPTSFGPMKLVSGALSTR